ncbi:MAG: hypothetical protein COA70_12885 [Planctomycetota bacterium]|nr:MAG: hypothetical protein COA70_12885 [Planctomycetota bacterium]
MECPTKTLSFFTLFALSLASNGCTSSEMADYGRVYSTPQPTRHFDPEVGLTTDDDFLTNAFQNVSDHPLSTFSIDVDTASYSMSRNFLLHDELPPREIVRTEEFLNYFTYDYAQPTGESPISTTFEMAACPWNAGHHLLLVGLQAKDIPKESIPASNLVFLLDVSGSMSARNKLPLLQDSMRLLVAELRPQDRVAIVTYAGSAGLVLDSTPGTEKTKILSAINALSSGGSTAGGEGIELAYSVASDYFQEDGNNRIILATDGDFNVGISDDSELVQLIASKREQNIFLSVLGFGNGNYRDHKMEGLADHGNGNYTYIDSLLEAKKALVTEFGSTMYTVAKDVKLQIEFNPAAVSAYRLIGYENRMLEDKDFNDDRKDAGEMGSGHQVTALYEIIPADSLEAHGGVDALKYQQASMPKVAPNEEWFTLKVRYKDPHSKQSTRFEHSATKQQIWSTSTSRNFDFASSVAECCLVLRDSEFKAEASLENAIARGKLAKGTDLQGYRSEFLLQMEKAKLLLWSTKDLD